jgi:hypothetical protein
MIWIAIAAIFAGGAWYWGRRAHPTTLWIRVAVAAVLLAACVASYLQFGASAEKTFAGVAGYFLLWASVYGAAALCAGVIVGSLIVLLVG